MKAKVILDTNFLLIPGQFGVDIFSEINRICTFPYELCVVPETMAELERLLTDEKTSAKDRRAAKLGMQLLKAFKVKTYKNYRKLFKRADEAIIAIADKNSFVATQDRDLRKKLKGICGLIILRQKQYLMLFGEKNVLPSSG